METRTATLPTGTRTAGTATGDGGPYRALRCCPAERPSGDEDGGVQAWKAEILEHLSLHGPTPVRHLPARWPLTRPLAGALLREMAAEGLVEMDGALAHRGWRTARLTPKGHRALAPA